MKYFSMFTGIGGFEYGIEKAYNNKYESEKSGSTDIESRGVGNINQRERSFLFTNNPPLCVGFSEIDKYAIQIYKQHYPNHKNYGSATEINPEELPNFDMLCGGFPCQAFSIAGKRMGFEDTRGTLFFDIARIAKVKRPRFLFLENVKGLLNHDNGRTFTTILATLDELGYNAEWEVLNSKYFGVPQNRERVFIIGHLRGTSSRQIFPLGQGDEKDGVAIKRLGHMKGFRRYNQTYDVSGSVEALDTSAGGGHQPCIICPTITTELAHSTGRDFFRNMGHQINKAMIVKELEKEGLEPTEKGWGSLNRVMALDLYNHKVHSDRTPTLTEPHHNNLRMQVGNKIRRLTPIECERLQGFPDNWTEGVSDTQRYKTLGNAVTTNVITAIMEKMRLYNEKISN